MLSIVFFGLGACMGSFLTLAAVRSIRGQDWVRSRSVCDHCQKTLGFFDLIPIVSFIGTGGKSRCCRKKISLLYPLSEIMLGLAFAVIGTHFFSTITLAMSVQGILIFSIVSLLWVIFISDLQFEIIPVKTLIATALLSLMIVFFRSDACTTFVSPGCVSSILPNVAAGFFPGLIFFFLWFFSHGKAMGDGDISLVFLLGFLLGYPSILVVLYVAFLTGAIAGVILIVGRKKTLKSHISFGPFLIAGAGVAVLWGAPIIKFVTNMWF